jgi:hypothetical protein
LDPENIKRNKFSKENFKLSPSQSSFVELNNKTILLKDICDKKEPNRDYHLVTYPFPWKNPTKQPIIPKVENPEVKGEKIVHLSMQVLGLEEGPISPEDPEEEEEIEHLETTNLDSNIMTCMKANWNLRFFFLIRFGEKIRKH